MNPLLLPPRLLFRALDDLHTLAVAAARLERVEERLNERADAIIAMGDRIDARTEAILDLGERIVEMGARMDGRAEAVIEMGARVVALGEQMDARSEAILDQGERVVAAAREVADRGEQLALALPVMQRAIEMAEPLEGVVERLGRVADRLPGGARARSGSSARS